MASNTRRKSGRERLELTGRTRFSERLYTLFLGRDRLNRSEALSGYIFSLPWLVGFLLLTIGPFVVAIVMSFYRWPGYGPSQFVGFHNFQFMFTEDQLFTQALKVTFSFVFSAVPIQIIVAFAIAMVLSKRLFGVAVLRSMFYLPSVVTGVAITFVWMYIFEPINGPLNLLLMRLGVINKPIAWLSSPEWVLPSFILMYTWTLGSSMVIILAGIKSVPSSLYESALIDGAGWFRRVWHITIPMVSPALFYVFVMGFIRGFQILTEPLVIFGSGLRGETATGPLNSGLFYSLYLYNSAFRLGRMGYANALAWVLFVIILAVTIANFVALGRRVHYEE